MSTLDPILNDWLQQFLKRHGAVAGTVHLMGDGVLRLEAAVNIPPKVQEVTRTIPKGKGMAGLAWERNRPVSTCNLATDDTGDVRHAPGMIEMGETLATRLDDLL